MNFSKSIFSVALLLALGFSSCKQKDADVQTAVETKMKTNADASDVMVTVNDGVATLTGVVKDDATKAAIATAAKDVKGVKSVVDNTTVAEAVTVAPPVIAADDPLMNNVMDATKDYPGVSATVTDGVVMVNGTISAANWKKLKMTLDGLNPKRVDGTQLTIK